MPTYLQAVFQTAPGRVLQQRQRQCHHPVASPAAPAPSAPPPPAAVLSRRVAVQMWGCRSAQRRCQLCSAPGRGPAGAPLAGAAAHAAHPELPGPAVPPPAESPCLRTAAGSIGICAPGIWPNRAVQCSCTHGSRARRSACNPTSLLLRRGRRQGLPHVAVLHYA